MYALFKMLISVNNCEVYIYWHVLLSIVLQRKPFAFELFSVWHIIFFLSQLHGFVWKTSIKHGYMYCTFINTIFEYRAMFFVLIPMYIMYEVCIEEIKPRKV